MIKEKTFDRNFFEGILNRKYFDGKYICPKHGEVDSSYYIVENNEKVWEECPECAKERELEIAKRQEQENFEKQKLSWVNSNIKEKFFNMSFDDYEVVNDTQRLAKEKLIAIANGGNRSLLLLGSNGLGKTMLSSIALKQRGGYIFKMYEIIIKIKSSYKSNSSVDEADILNMLSECPLLVIDEVGKQFGSESEKNWLSYVIDERYERNRPTVLISNLKLMKECSEEEKNEGLYSERYLGRDSVSRLVECADIVTITGEDYRRRSHLTQ